MNNNNTEFCITFGSKFSNESYIDEDGKEYVKAIPNSGMTIIFGANVEKYVKDESIRNTKEYKQWLRNVLSRDNNSCRCCESVNNLEVHHILPYAKYKSLRIDVDNGISLCECCHSSMILGGFHQTYGTRNNTKEQLQEYIDKKREVLGLSKVTIDEIINGESITI